MHPGRAQALLDELLELVAATRQRAAVLEAEREELRRKVAALESDARAPPSQADGDGRADTPSRERRGDMRAALKPALAAGGRSSPALVALLGEDAGRRPARDTPRGRPPRR
jgi:hypothetical protein